MTLTTGRTFRSYRCATCRTISRGDPEPTVVPGLVLGYCISCKRKMPSTEELELPETTAFEAAAIAAIRAKDPDVETLLGPGDRFWIGEFDDRRLIDRAEALSALESGEDGGTIVRASEDDVAAIRSEDDHVQAAYLEWRRTQDGMAVVEAIRRRAVELRRRGWRRYGIQALAEVVRFDRALSVGPDAAGYKVNNSHLSRLARDLMGEDRDLDGFFEVRELRSDGAAGGHA